MQPDVVVVHIGDAIAVAIAPHYVPYAIATWSASVPPAISGIVAVYKFATLAIVFGPTRLVAIVSPAILAISIHSL
jgi:hypothetical protein